MTRSLMFLFLLASGTVFTYWHQANGQDADYAHQLEDEIYLQGEDNAQVPHYYLDSSINGDADSVDNGGDDSNDRSDDDDDDVLQQTSYSEDEDDDDDDDDDDNGDLLEALELHATFLGYKGKKVKFDYSTDVDEQPPAYSSDEEPEEGTQQQLENMRWVAVTADGYEYEEDLDEVKELMSEAMAEDDDDLEGLELGNEGNGDVPENSYQRQRRRVFGHDSRQLVTNTMTFPYSAVGRLDTGCTGTFISPHHVLTAAHCVFNRRTGRWNRNLNFGRRKACDPNPGRRHVWKHVVSVRGYIRHGLAAYDYALITYYNRSPVWMGYGYTTRRRLRSGAITIAGYPSDKQNWCMWRSTCSVRRRFFRFLRFFYRCDTARGMSGSAVFKRRRRWHIVYGIHAYGGSRYNSATRITRRRFHQLRHWIRKYK